MSELIHIEQAPGSTICIARVSGDIDLSAVPELREAVDSAVARGCRVLVSDLTEVTYMDSSALAFLVWADRRLEPLAGRLVLAGANEDVTRIIELSGLIGAVPTVSAASSVDEAISSVQIPHEVFDAELVVAFSFPADASSMGGVRSRIGEIVAPFGLPESSQFDLKVAVGEALANAVRHGSPRGSADEVGVEVRVFPDRVVVTVSDSGYGFTGEAVADSDVYASNGRGVLFMRALADSVEFDRTVAGGTLVRLAKRRPMAAQATRA